MAASKFDVDEFLREELTVDNLRKLLKAELKIVAQTLNVDVTACIRIKGGNSRCHCYP